MFHTSPAPWPIAPAAASSAAARTGLHCRAAVAWTAGAVLCALVALTTLPQWAWADLRPASMADAPSAASVPGPAATRIRTRCTTCGVVEAIRMLDPVGQEPSAYAFTVRLRDGSERVSTVAATTAAAWAVGDAIMLIGGL